MVIEPVPLSSWVVGVVYVLGVWDETLNGMAAPT